MPVINVLAVAFVTDFDEARDFYARLLGRGPDLEPMDGSAVWQLAGSGALQINAVPDRAGGSAVVISVDDVDVEAAAINDRGFALHPEDEPTGTFRLAALDDPAGNTVTFAQVLAGPPEH